MFRAKCETFQLSRRPNYRFALRLVQTSLIWLRICSWLRQRCLFFSKNRRPLQKRTNGNFSNFSQLNMQTVNKTTRFIESDLDWDNDVQNFVSINLESKLLRVLKLHRFGTDFSFQSQNVLSLTFRWTAIKVHDDGRYVNVLFCHGSRHQRANIFWPFSTHSRLVSNKTRFNLSSFKQTRWSSPNGALTHKCKQIPRGIVENASYKNSCLNTFANLQLSAFIKRRRLLQIRSPLRLVWISL